MNIASFYRMESFGAADKFLSSVRSFLLRLENAPFIYQIANNTIRRIPMGKFPYNIFYTIDGNNVSVLAIVHQKRSPAIWHDKTTIH
jgi:hypothetical protein